MTWYDSRDEPVQETSPVTGTTNTTYDATGQRVSTSTAAGVTSYVYNADGSLEDVNYTSPGSGFASAADVAYTYDADGNRTSMTDGTGTTTYGYDALERVVSVVNGDGLTVGYSYDLDDDRTGMTYPGASGETVSYTFDGAGEERRSLTGTAIGRRLLMTLMEIS